MKLPLSPTEIILRADVFQQVSNSHTMGVLTAGLASGLELISSGIQTSRRGRGTAGILTGGLLFNN
jgi:hypothetical protein